MGKKKLFYTNDREHSDEKTKEPLKMGDTTKTILPHPMQNKRSLMGKRAPK